MQNSSSRKRKRLDFAYEYFKDLGNIHHWLFTYKELLLENIRSVQVYLQKCMLQSMYKLVFVYLCISFCFIGSKQLFYRIGFLLRILIGVLQFPYIFNENHSIRSLFALMSYLINILLGIIDSKNYLTDYALFALISSFSPLPTKFKFISALCITCINLLIFSDTIPTKYLLIAFFLHCYVIIISYSNDLVMNILFKKLKQIQEKTELEIKSKGMFVASISHDLKNPLNSLLGCLDLLKNSINLTESEKNYLITASYSGQIMRYLIGNILDSSKIEAGKFDIDTIPMDILTEVSKIILIEKELSKKKGINLYMKVLTPLPKFVYGDAMRFSQILINIIGNSIKFVSKGYIGITLSWTTSINNTTKVKDSFIPPEEFFLVPEFDELSTKTNGGEDCEEHDLKELPIPVWKTIRKYSGGLLMAKRAGKLMRPHDPGKPIAHPSSQLLLQKQENSFGDQEKVRNKSHICDSKINPFSIKKRERVITKDSGLLVIDIIDTGIGISEEEQKRLFKPFNQANSLVRSQYGGTGLGLWITKQLVYLMSGFIELQSQPKKGTRFTITLPFKVVKEEDILLKPFEEHKAPPFDRTDITLTKESIEVVCNLRSNEKLFLVGEDKSLHRMRILLLEDSNTMNDLLVEQVINQLRNSDGKLYYAVYDNGIEVLKREKYKFNVIVFICSEQSSVTMKAIVNVMKSIKDAEYKQMPMCVISGTITKLSIIEYANKEFDDLNKVTLFTFPLKDGEFIKELNKLRAKALYFSSKRLGDERQEVLVMTRSLKNYTRSTM